MDTAIIANTNVDTLYFSNASQGKSLFVSRIADSNDFFDNSDSRAGDIAVFVIWDGNSGNCFHLKHNGYIMVRRKSGTWGNWTQLI